MGRKPKYTKEIKKQAVLDYQSGRKTLRMLSKEIDCSTGTIHRWINNYISIGEEAFNDKTNNRSYSKEFKLAVVKEYLLGNGLIIYLKKIY